MEGTSSLGLNVVTFLMNSSNETNQKPLTKKNDGVDIFRFYFTGICIVVGILGNSTSILVFLKSRVSESTCTVRFYLIALAISDNVVLIAEVFVWISEDWIGIEWINRYDVLCKGSYYFRYAGRMWSAFLTLTITAERYLFVAYPLKSASLRTANWCKIGILLTANVSFSLATYALFLIGTSETKYCIIYNDQKTTFVIVDIIISRCFADVLVGLAIFVLTGCMIRSLLKARYARENTLNGGCSLSRRQTRESQITIMLFTIAILFVVIKIPYTITYYLSFNMNKQWNNSLYGITDAKNIAGAFVILNYAINFFVYFVFVRSFRENFFRYVSCKKYYVSEITRNPSTESYKLTTNV